MSYKTFQDKVKVLMNKAGIASKARFFIHDDGRYFAQCDGVTIIGRPGSLSVKVCWGSGHSAAATI